jgi:hypothetical protein
LLAEWKEVGVYSIAYKLSEGSPPFVPFFSASSSCKSWGSGPVPEKQYIVRVGLVRLVKGKKVFCLSVLSNHSPDVQKLFLVIRDSSSNIMYKISKEISYKKCK